MTPVFEPGKRYRLTKQLGYLPAGTIGEFVEWTRSHCQLHGELIGKEAVFQKIKTSDKIGCLFGVRDDEVGAFTSIETAEGKK